MILCEIKVPHKGINELIKIDDRGKGREIIGNLLKMYGNDNMLGYVISLNKKGVVNPELSLYEQGIRNGDTLVLICL